jgi:hypothetical protein
MKIQKFENILDCYKYVLKSFRDDKSFQAVLCEIVGKGVFWVGFDKDRENICFHSFISGV